MDAITMDALPRFIETLCGCAYSIQVEGKEKPTTDLSSLFSTQQVATFSIPNIDACNPAEHADKELKIVELACDYAVRAIASYTQKLLLATKSHRNSSLPVYRLPNEVLSIIFELAESTASDLWQRSSTKNPINLSQVSRRWRDLALNLPTLWTTIGATEAHRDPFIKRSNPCLMDIIVPPHKNRYYWSPGEESDPAYDVERYEFPARRSLLEPFIPHVERWGKLALGGLRFAEFGEMNLPLASNLHSLYLFNSVGSLRSSTRLGTHAPFAERPPNLSRLTLCRFILPFTSSMFVGLAELYLENLLYPSGTAQDLLGIFAACPRLRRVKMDHVRFTGPSQQVVFSDPGSVALSHLRSMELFWMDHTVIRSILSSITVPSTLRLGIHTPHTPSYVLPPAAILGQCLPNLLSVTALFVEVKPGPNEVRLSGKASGDDNLLEATFNFHHRPALSKTLEKVASELGRHVPGLPLHTLSLLRIHDDQLSSLTFAGLVSNFPTLVVLSLNECNASSFLSMLIITPTTQLCPSLQVLCLRRSYVSNRTFVEFVNSRRSRLLRIDVTCCYGFEDDFIAELRRIPLEVNWVP